MIEIRACTPDDAVAVSTLLGELGYIVSIRQATEHVRELSKTGADPIFLAAADGQILGLLAAHLCRMLQYATPVMRVTALVVDRRARRRGVGKLLMERAEQIGSAAGCEFVELTSAMDRAEAHAFYRSIGYEPNSLRFRKPLVRQYPR
ncbi:MAG: GNAT family N-acetyltransferase [Alphaproteobacteria bacterium]|nr:GNAT family N-acetyltransferase [Alphaproteobacteria bacterium]